jgi:hypothetical protein
LFIFKECQNGINISELVENITKLLACQENISFLGIKIRI